MVSVVSFSQSTIFLTLGDWMSTEKKRVSHLEREPVTSMYITLSITVRTHVVGAEDMTI